MAERNPMTAVGDTISLDIAPDRVGVVGVQISSKQADGVTAVDAGATVVVEATWNEVDWITLTLRNPATKADVTSLVGPNIAGWADIPAARKVRARLTVVPAGNVPVRVNIS